MTSLNSGIELITPSIDAVLERMEANAEGIALIWKEQNYTYSELFNKIRIWEEKLDAAGLGAGQVCAFQGDYSPEICALIFALIRRGCILVPFTLEIETEIESFIEISETEVLFKFNSDDTYTIQHFTPKEQNPLIADFCLRKHPGLIVFTSVSTGTPKGLLHD